MIDGYETIYQAMDKVAKQIRVMKIIPRFQRSKEETDRLNEQMKVLKTLVNFKSKLATSERS